MLHEQVKTALQRLPIKGRCGVAVSGGGDSMALALLLKELLGEVVALHFDHGLRHNSAEEAQWVEASLKRHHIPTVVARWESPASGTNLQEQAREARYRFFRQACDDVGLQAVFVAHSADDVAETFLMRLGRGSGLHGLSVLPEVAKVQGVTIFRPLLEVRRADLRSYLQDKKQDWLEDPSNANTKFWRPRVRKLLPQMQEAGIETPSVLASVRALQEANDALHSVTEKLWDQIAVKEAGEVALSWGVLKAQPVEIQVRLMQKALRQFTPEDEQLPRRSQIKAALEALVSDPRQRSLGKTLCRREGTGLVFIMIG
jgi:tRNA(Ile)-lysidine synthase